MSHLYGAYQSLFEQLQKRQRANRISNLRVMPAETDQVDALRALKNKLQATAAALEAALFDLQNSGQTNPDLSNALSIANHCAAGAAQLLVATLDGSEEVRAATADMNASSDALDAIKTSTQELVDNLDRVTSVLTSAGKVLELIKS